MPLEPGVPLVHHRHATERPPATCVERSQFGRNVSIPAEAMRTRGTPNLAFRVVFRVVFGRDGAISKRGRENKAANSSSTVVNEHSSILRIFVCRRNSDRRRVILQRYLVNERSFQTINSTNGPVETHFIVCAAPESSGADYFIRFLDRD